MNRTILIGTLVFLLIGFSAVGAQVISDFRATAEDQNAVLTWKTENEAHVRHFVVQRSFDGNRFHNIATIEPNGEWEYRYVDTDLFKENLNTYYYRLETLLSNGRTQTTPTQSVVISSSRIARTWGSIKAMFR